MMQQTEKPIIYRSLTPKLKQNHVKMDKERKSYNGNQIIPAEKEDNLEESVDLFKHKFDGLSDFSFGIYLFST